MMVLRPLPPPHWQAVGHHQLGATGSMLSTLSFYSRFYQLQENLIGCPLLGFECTWPHKLIGSGTIMRCGFVGVGMILLEKVFHCQGEL